MYVLITYKDEKNQMKNEGARVVTTLYSYILDGYMCNNVSGPQLTQPKISLIVKKSLPSIQEKLSQRPLYGL